MCCLNRKIKLPLIPSPPGLNELFYNQSTKGRHFRQNIRAYNHVFAFTSMDVHVDEILEPRRSGGLPNVSQAAAIIIGNGEFENLRGQNITVQTNHGQLINVQDYVGYYDLQQYPL